MRKPSTPHNELSRLQTLRSLELLDTEAEERFDRVTRLARRLFGVPIVLVSLVDEHRQWFKSNQGLDATETPRDISFCGHAILDSGPLIVPDAREDERFASNPLVTGSPYIRFYAGQPISATDGSRMGTLCLIDHAPRRMSAEDQALLRDLAGMVEDELRAIRLATIDPLTGLCNRSGFEMLAAHAFAFCARHDKPASLLFMDLDGFKAINDEFGHQAGDAALATFSTLLQATFRESDVIARLGGDEFVVFLSAASDNEAFGAVQRLESLVRERNGKHLSPYEIRFSAGLKRYDPSRHATLEDLLEDADQEMYRQKQASQRSASLLVN
jgi:diguanylate cyclase (GGDEF)-like protein